MKHERETPVIPPLHSGETLASLRSGALRWVYDSGFHERLFGPAAVNWERLDEDPSARLVKDNPYRQVWRIVRGKLDLFVKVYRITHWRERIKWELRRCPAKLEFRRCLLAMERGIPAARPLGWALGPDYALLVLQALPPGFTLEQLLWDDCHATLRADERQMLPWLRAAGALIGTLHHARLLHDDLHAGNLYLAPDVTGAPRAWLIDLYKLRPAAREGMLSALHPAALANLAGLLSALSDRLAPPKVAALLESYLKTVQPHHVWHPDQIETYQNRLRPVMERYRLRLWKKYDRRCLRDSKYTQSLQPAPRWQARVYLNHKRPLDQWPLSRRGLTVPHWTAALETMLANYGRGKGLIPNETLLQTDPHHLISRGDLPVDGGGIPVTIHYHTPSSLPAFLKETLFPSAALRRWRDHWAAIHRLQPAVWPLAVLHRRRFGLVRQSIFIGQQEPPQPTIPCRRPDYRSILIVKPSSLGDVVRGLPIYYGLRQTYPNAHIHWLVNTSFAGLLEGIEGLQPILFERQRFGRMLTSWAATKDFVAFVRNLRNRHFDLVVDLQGLFRSALISRLTGAPSCIGFEYARELAPLFYTHAVGRDENRTAHVVEDNWAVAFPLGFHRMSMTFELPRNENAWQSMAAKLTSADAKLPDARFAVLLMGGSTASKRWPTGSFAALADELYRNHGIRSVLPGAGATEEELAAQVAGQSQNATHPVNLAGRTTLAEMTELLRRATLVIGNDSGPLHIAAALARPVVGLYGPTNPAKVGPFGQLDRVVAAGPEIPRLGRYCRHESHRIEQVALADVLRRVESILTEMNQSDMREKFKFLVNQIKHLIVRRILHIDDTPHRLALGIALGLFVGWTPTIGLQMAIAAPLALLFRANVQVSVIMVWVSNPLTLPLVYYPNYLLGRLLTAPFRYGDSASAYSYHQIKQILVNYHNAGSTWDCFFNAEFWKSLGHVLINVGVELWVGSLIFGLIIAVAAYFFSRRSIVWYREHTPMGRLFMRRLLRRKRLRAIMANRATEHSEPPKT